MIKSHSQKNEQKGKKNKIMFLIQSFIQNNINKFTGQSIYNFLEEIYENGERVIIFGKLYDFENKSLDLYQQLQELLCSLIKITYQKKIQIQDQNVTDFGWGCTIRCAQMFLANYLNLLSDGILDDKSDLINYFDSNRDFSFENFMDFGTKNLNLKIYQKWNQIQVFKAIEFLIENSSIQSLKNSVKVLISQGQIDFQQIEGVLKQQRQVILAINLQLGLDEISFKNQETILGLLAFVNFVGGFVCHNNQSYYMIGFKKKKDKILYLDPHWLSNEAKTERQEMAELHSQKLNDAHPNMTFVFEIKTMGQLQDFAQQIDELQSDSIFQIKNEQQLIESISSMSFDNRAREDELMANVQQQHIRFTQESFVNFNLSKDSNVINKEQNLIQSLNIKTGIESPSQETLVGYSLLRNWLSVLNQSSQMESSAEGRPRTNSLNLMENQQQELH